MGFEIVYQHVPSATDRGKRVRVHPDQLPQTFGREFADGDSSMSKRHFELCLSENTLFLRDLESRNGTFVDGRRATPRLEVPLTDGSIVRSGESVFLFRFALSEEETDATDIVPGRAPSVVRARRILKQVASTDGPLLLIGPTGTGKEFAARGIHRLRGLPEDLFIPVNCAELDPSLARSELFGVEKGAFTDARASRSGLVFAAEHGTLFLDEIGELALQTQADLLRFLEDRTYRPVGGTVLLTSTARLLAATNVDLDEAVEAGTFRRDLLARLRAIVEPIILPPLADRGEDILDWFGRFTSEAAAKSGRVAPPWSAGVSETLLLHRWPENLRELRMTANVVLRAMTGGERIEASHLPERVARARVYARSDEILGIPSPQPNISDIPKEDIVRALDTCRGNVRQTARLLRIDRRKFYRLCERHGIDLGTHRKAR